MTVGLRRLHWTSRYAWY